MVVNDRTRRVLANRRTERDWTAEGFMEVSGHTNPLWKFDRGYWGRDGRRITEVRIAPNGHDLWIKVSEPDAIPGTE
jgi:hypothetical protein